MVRALLDSAIPRVDLPAGEIRGLLVPHAGYTYSGSVASHAYAAVEPGTHDTVVILGPYHAYHESPFLVCRHDGYRTPLGSVPIDHKLVDHIELVLAEETGLSLTRTAEATEHSIEIQLPFLQVCLPSFNLVPIMLAHQSPTTVAALVGALSAALQDKNPLLIASSDLSHFNPQHMANLLDSEILSRIEHFRAEAVLHAEEEGAGAACGAGAIAAVLLTSQAFGAQNAKVLDYRTSGDITGHLDSVVGYASAAFW
jgi:AmmeMemoRadiSam system protein B